MAYCNLIQLFRVHAMRIPLDRNEPDARETGKRKEVGIRECVHGYRIPHAKHRKEGR